MNAQEYNEAGFGWSTKGGWIISLDDSDPGAPELPVAIHRDTREVLPLEYLPEDGDRDNDAHWSQDWASSPLDNHWGQPAALIDDLRALYDTRRLRVRGAIHGLPGANRLGAVLC